MSRDTKIGLVVAAAFVSLIGGVLGYKLYFGDDPVLKELNQAHETASAGTVPAASPAAASAASQDSARETAVREAAPASPSAADAPPHLAPGQELVQGPPPAARPEPPPPEDPPSLGPPPPPPALPPPPTASDTPTSVPEPLPPPPEPPPPLRPDAPEVPGVPLPGPEEPPAPGPREPVPPRAEPPPPPEPVLPPQGSRPPALRRPASDPVPPPPPPTAFDRTYEVPVLGRPVAEGKSAGDSPGGASRGVRPSQAGQRQTDPPRADDGGIPVTVRPQPDIVRSDAGIPVVVRPPLWHTPDGRPPAHVESFDLEIYTVRPGDTYASISQLRYRSDRYQQALIQFNRERDPRLAELRPGMIVYLPPAGYLERRYGVPAPPASGPDVPPGPATGRTAPTPAPGTQGRAVAPGRPAQPTASPAGGAPAVHLPAGPHPAEGQEIAPASWNGPAGGKRYRVRPQDTLWSIAKETLGSGDRWPEILRLNREQLPDAARLRPGMVLRLPDDARLDARDAPP